MEKGKLEEKIKTAEKYEKIVYKHINNSKITGLNLKEIEKL